MPTNCECCGSDDLEQDGNRVTCMECDANAVFLGDWCEWVSPRTARRARALEADTLRRLEED